jgi:nitroreductase
MPDARQPGHPVDPLFTRRWSPRAYTGEAMPVDALMSLFEAARWAPSASNVQPWRFVFARRDTPAWAPLLGALVDSNRVWAQQASVLVAVLSTTTTLPPGKTEARPVATHAFDAGAAWMSLALQATTAGWAAHAMGGFDHGRLRAALGIPDDVAAHAVVAIGRQADKASLPADLQARETPNQRLPLAATVAEGRYGFNI